MAGFDLADYVRARRKAVDDTLDRVLPRQDGGPGAILLEAMRYSVMAGGKRIRPILLLAGAEAVGGDPARLLPISCAVECIHTYSLIHDDLPAMDNDDLRRGRPTCHKVYGEAVAILAGDALLTLAFDLMTRSDLTEGIRPRLLAQAVQILAVAAGGRGMVGGQTADILAEGRAVDGGTLEFIHKRKTGALIAASVEMGGLLGGGTVDKVASLREYGLGLGLAFQVTDDLLDVLGDPALMGKEAGADARREKATYPAIFGIEAAKAHARTLVEGAIKALSGFGEEAEPLRAIARYVEGRDR